MLSARSLVPALLVVPLLAAGCATAPEPASRPESPPQVASTWTALASAPVPPSSPDLALVPWVDSFHDSTLSALVTEGLAHNHDLQALARSLEAARATATIAGADRLPQLTAGADAAGRQTAVETPAGVTSIRTENYGLGLNLSWEIDLWGRLRDGTAAAIADTQATEADLAAARLSLAGQIAKAWFRTSTARLQLALAEDTVRSFQSSADLVRNRFEAGISTSLELRLALANAAAARALREQRRQELDTASRQLEALLGRYPAAHIGTINTLPTPPAAVPAGLPADLLARRPDILAANRRLAAADARVRQAQKAMLPALRLTGSGGTASTELSDLLDADYTVWSIAAGLTQPIFQGGRLRAAADRATALAEGSHATYLQTVQRAFLEVETRLAAETTLRSREENLLEAATHSDGAERLARDEYEAGLSDIITMLESQRRALEARSTWLSVREQRLDNRVDLHLALGGDFTPPGS